MLEIAHLSVVRGEGNQSFRVTLPRLHIRAGEVVSFCGSSGCGKSTLLEAIGLILHPQQVEKYYLAPSYNIAPLLLNNQQKDLAHLRAEHFGFMLQTGGLVPFLTIKENLALPSQIIHKRLDEEWIYSLIERLEIKHLLHVYPHQLSIGERQRVAFIRAISHKPSILLADEPTAALDPHKANTLFDLIIKTVQEQSIAAIIVTHDWQAVKTRAIHTLTAQQDSPYSTVFCEGEI